MVIFGIDPGIERTGFGILEYTGGSVRALDFGCIKTSKSAPIGMRLLEIESDIEALLKKWKPDGCILEKLFFSKNVKTAMIVSQARGVILNIFEKHGVPVHEMNPGTIKSSITGNGRADKTQIKRMVQRLLRLSSPIRSDDAADAMAGALCFAQLQNVSSIK